jgi:hypothetical protein
MHAGRRPVRDGYMTWHGVRDFIYITASQKRPAEVEFYCAETPHTFTVPSADKA